MKGILSLLLIFLIKVAVAQNRSGFMEIDWRVQAINTSSLDSLAQQLTYPYTTDDEKVRSIFRWITEHIAYKVRSYRSIRTPVFSSAYYPQDTALKNLDERVAQNVIRNREAVCDGYARLFKSLCSLSGIKSELITGYARTNIGRAKFRSNHTWNAVFIDSSWHLLDVTWASGYISFSNEFVKAYDDSYFLTPPKDFIQDHYPEDLKWTLLPHPPTLQEFDNAPFTSKAFVTSRILSYLPSKGVIEASVGDSIRVELETDEIMKLMPSPDTLSVDSTILSASMAFLKPASILKGKKVSYTYTVASPAVEWLNIMYNDELLMRYKLIVKNKTESLFLK